LGKSFVLVRSNKKGSTRSKRGQQSNRESSVNGEMPARHRIAGFNIEFRTVAPLKPQTNPPRPYHDPSNDVKRLCGVVIAIQNLALSRQGFIHHEWTRMRVVYSVCIFLGDPGFCAHCRDLAGKCRVSCFVIRVS